MQKKNLMILLVLLLVGLLVFSGCQRAAEEPTPTPDPTPAPSEEPVEEEPEVVEEEPAEEVTETEPEETTPTPAPTPAPSPGPAPSPEVTTEPEPEPEFDPQADFDNFVIVNDEEGYTNVDARRFKFFVDTFSEEFAIIIDASSREEFQAKHIPKARNIPAVQIWEYLDVLDKEKNILVYGQNDRQSLYATKVLAENGFPYVFRLQGNLKSWTDRDFPTERIVTQGDLDNVRDIIEGLPEGTEKEEMREKLRQLQATIDLQEPVSIVEELANNLDQEGRATQDEINRARSAYEATRQLALEKQIDVRDSDIIERLARAEAKIVSAQNQKYVLEAREAIDVIRTETDAEYARLLAERVVDEELRNIMYSEIRAKVQIAEEEDAIDTAVSIAESLNRDGTDTQEEINRAKAAYEIATRMLAESDIPDNLRSIEEAKLLRALNFINEAQDALDVKNAQELLRDLGIS